jgi:hypothetical protein
MKQNHKYLIAIDAIDRILTYTIIVLEVEDLFFKVKERDGKIMHISKDRVIYFIEVGE